MPARKRQQPRKKAAAAPDKAGRPTRARPKTNKKKGPTPATDQADRLVHDAERAEAGAAFARSLLGAMHQKAAGRLDRKAAALRARAEKITKRLTPTDPPPITAEPERASAAVLEPSRAGPPGVAGPEDTREKIIQSLANPAHRPLTVSQRCDVIGIGRSTWYEHLADPTFAPMARKAYRQLGMEELGPVMDALISSAKFLGKEGHGDRKLFLELMGEYQPGTSGRGRAAEPPEEGKDAKGPVLTDQQLCEWFEGREHLLPAGVLRRLGRDPDATFDAEQDAQRGSLPQPKAAAA